MKGMEEEGMDGIMDDKREGRGGKEEVGKETEKRH